MNNNESARLSGIAGIALRHSKAIVILIIGLCAWGIASIFILPSGIYPDVAFPRIVVIAERGEDSVENMMIGVTRPMVLYVYVRQLFAAPARCLSIFQKRQI
jgi:Cu/Ag efflux pump CusA